MTGNSSQPRSETTSTPPTRRRRRGPRHPVRQFVIVLLVLMGGFTALFYGWFSKSPIFDAYLAANARVSAALLRVLGEDDATADGIYLTSSRSALSIKRGCDAIQPSVFFALLLAASPVTVSWLRRGAWMIAGTLLLLAVNLFRIITLYYTIIWYSPQTFELMHVEVWQTAFVILPITMWLLWVRAMTPKPAMNPDADT